MPSGKIEKSKVIDPAVPPTLTRAEGFRIIYADTSKLGYSPWDIRLTFGLLLEDQPERTVNQEQVAIILSPGHAKTLQRILNEQIPVWEEQFGSVRDPLAPENLGKP
ncbi:MAG: hypothetical protein QOE96_1078 [Blastocatellia bacterium]|nr:hypothetical protein [Blastocatellia bacterium]